MSVSLVQVLGYPILVYLCSDNLCDFWFESCFFSFLSYFLIHCKNSVVSPPFFSCFYQGFFLLIFDVLLCTFTWSRRVAPDIYLYHIFIENKISLTYYFVNGVYK